jgi:membrane protease YdiL (CAAX protease family)
MGVNEESASVSTTPEPPLGSPPDSSGSRLGVPDAPPDAHFVTLGLCFYGLVGAAAVIWRIGFYHESILYANAAAEQAGLSPVRDLALGLLAGGLLIAISDWMTRATAWGERLARAMAEVLGRLSLPDALLLALASGLAEEAFFRGALQPRVGWLVASVIFGCAHFIPRREFLPWTAFALVAGVIFAALFEGTGNLIAPVTAHVVVNAVNLPWLIRRYGPNASGEPPRSPGFDAEPPAAP